MTMSDSHTWWCDTRSKYFLNPRRTTKSCWKHPNKQNKTLFISTEGAKVSQEAKNVTAKRSEHPEIIEHYVRRSRYSVSTTLSNNFRYCHEYSIMWGQFESNKMLFYAWRRLRTYMLPRRLRTTTMLFYYERLKEATLNIIKLWSPSQLLSCHLPPCLL